MSETRPDTPPDYRNRPDIRRHLDSLGAWLSLKHLSGLEIGPLDKPLVRRKESDIHYLDRFDLDHLRNTCAGNPNRDENKLVALDYVLEDRTIAEAVDRRFDYIVACHIIEHVPNMLGWLRELADVLNPEGAFFLVVPDRRYTFDLERPLTTIGELIENDAADRKRPSIRAVFDQRYYHRNVSAHHLWKNYEKERGRSKKTFTAEQAMSLAKEARKRYVDVHCNVFDSDTFTEVIRASHDLGLHPFACEQLRPTEKPFLDFVALLRRVR